jgi:hypothetical protein
MEVWTTTKTGKKWLLKKEQQWKAKREAGETIPSGFYK